MARNWSVEICPAEEKLYGTTLARTSGRADSGGRASRRLEESVDFILLERFFRQRRRPFAPPRRFARAIFCGPSRAGRLPSRQVAQRGAQMHYRRGMHLRDPRFHHAQSQPDLAHGHLFVVIERHHQAFPVRQILDGGGQPLLQLAAQTTKERILFRPSRHVGELFLA